MHVQHAQIEKCMFRRFLHQGKIQKGREWKGMEGTGWEGKGKEGCWRTPIDITILCMVWLKYPCSDQCMPTWLAFVSFPPVIKLVVPCSFWHLQPDLNVRSCRRRIIIAKPPSNSYAKGVSCSCKHMWCRAVKSWNLCCMQNHHLLPWYIVKLEGGCWEGLHVGEILA